MSYNAIQNDRIEQDNFWQCEFSKITTKAEFRFVMKLMAEQHYDIVFKTYATEYWMNYPYRFSEPEIFEPQLDNEIKDRLRHTYMHVLFFCFRCRKCREINTPNLFEGHDILIKKFWKFYPVADDRAYCDILVYTQEAIEYNIRHPDSEPYPMPSEDKLEPQEIRRIKSEVSQKLYRLPG